MSKNCELLSCEHCGKNFKDIYPLIARILQSMSYDVGGNDVDIGILQRKYNTGDLWDFEQILGRIPYNNLEELTINSEDMNHVTKKKMKKFMGAKDFKKVMEFLDWCFENDKEGGVLTYN